MRNIKKVLLIIPLVFVLVLSSCYNGYAGKRSDLYSVAINSVVWSNGYSWGADFKMNSKIEIIDVDQYGRTLFTYTESVYDTTKIAFSSLIICQASTAKEVFYYEDVNYIVKEQVLYIPYQKEFNEEEIENLKLINDWNKEINYSKCIKKDIRKGKLNIPHEKEIKNQILDEFDMTSDCIWFAHYLTSNFDNTKYIMYGYVGNTREDGTYFIGLVEKGENNTIKINTIVPLDVYNYKNEFVEFKQANNWYDIDADLTIGNFSND